MNFRLTFWHHHSIPWFRFPYRERYFSDTRTFSDEFCIGYAECPPYFYFRSSWPTDLESVSRDAHLVVTVSTKFEVDTTIRCLVIASLLLIRYVTLWPFDFAQWWYMVGHVVNPSTKFDDPTAIRSWVTSSDISCRIPLTGEGRSLGGKISGGRGRPPASILISLERQLIALQLCCWQFLYNETLQQTFRPLLSKSSKRRHI